MEITSSYLTTKILEALPSLSLSEKQIINDILSFELKDCTIEKQTFELLECNYNLQLIEEYYNHLTMSVKSDKTIKQYLYAIKGFITWYKKDIKLTTWQDLQMYYSYYARQRKDIKPVSMRNLERYISPFFRFLVKYGYIQSNPAEFIEAPKVPDPNIEGLTLEELEVIKCTIKNDKNYLRNRALIEFMVATGCRVTEISECKLSCVNFNDKSVYVIGKGNKPRVVYFNGTCAKYLKDYLSTRTDNMDCLFLSKNKTKLSKNAIEEYCRNIGAETNIRCNPHRFRHTFAQTCVNRGMSVENLSKLMGHSDISTTQRYFNVNQTLLGNEYKKFVS